MGIGAGLRMPVDIFPEIDIPVVSVVWTYQGMSAPDIRDRILTLHQRHWPRWWTTSAGSRRHPMPASRGEVYCTKAQRDACHLAIGEQRACRA